MFRPIENVIYFYTDNGTKNDIYPCKLSYIGIEELGDSSLIDDFIYTKIEDGSMLSSIRLVDDPRGQIFSSERKALIENRDRL